jgi:hypothetical protein
MESVVSECRCDPGQYFERPAGSKEVRIDLLIRDHIPSPEKITEAVLRMEKARKGEYPKREPISVKKLDNGKLLVVDGNTTTTVMKDWGCKHIIAVEIG